MRYISSVLVLVLSPLIVFAQSVTLPEKLTGLPGQTIIINPTKVDGGRVKWLLDAGLKDVTDTLVAPGTVNWRAVVAEKAGSFRVVAYNAKSDVASDPAIAVIIIGGGNGPVIDPIPGEDPLSQVKKDIAAIATSIAKIDARVSKLENVKPPVPIAPIAAHITFVGPEKEEGSLTTNNDVVLRKWLSDNGIKVHVFKENAAGIKEAGLTNAVEKAEGVPCAIIQDGLGNVIAQGRLTTEASVRTLVAPFLKKK